MEETTNQPVRMKLKEKYNVGYTSPRITAKPRTGSRVGKGAKLHKKRLESRYRHGAFTPSRIARKGR